MGPKESFSSIIRSVINISNQELNSILSIANVREFDEGQCFIRIGEVPNKIAFLVRGLFRYYYIDTKGNEFTKGFITEGSIISSYSAMIQNDRSHFAIEALEDSIVLVMEYRKFKAQFKDKANWYKLMLHFVERGFCIKEKREREFLLLTATQRYESFLTTYPDLADRIQQHLIASYIGVTPVSLSRIKKNKKINN